jgi:transposase InsO family protein
VNRRQLATIEYLREENRVLREQLGLKRLVLTDAQRRRLALKGKALSRELLNEACSIVTPDTILRWYKQLIARKYDGTAKRRAGRPRAAADIRDLIVRMATENPGWGYTRVVGAMENLGFDVGRTTVARILAEHGIAPAPGRGKSLSWKEFLRAHWDAIAAADFFTVEALTLWGLTRYHVLFVMELKTRAVHIAGIVHEPDARWVMQVGRNLLDAVDGFLLGKRHLVLDRDPVFTQQFRRLLKESSVQPVRLSANSPNLNAYGERFVGSIGRECLDKMVLLGERHLRQVVAEYAARYRSERNHQGLDNDLIEPSSEAVNDNGPIRCRKRLGGLLKHYHRQAA